MKPAPDHADAPARAMASFSPGGAHRCSCGGPTHETNVRGISVCLRSGTVHEVTVERCARCRRRYALAWLLTTDAVQMEVVGRTPYPTGQADPLGVALAALTVIPADAHCGIRLTIEARRQARAGVRRNP